MSNYIKGIDISNNNGSIDFSKVAASGVEYVYVKATEGQSFKDGTMERFFNECKANGLKVGVYHFLVGTSSPEAQAQNFHEKIKDFKWDLVPMMDVETNFDGLSDYVVGFVAAFKQLSPLKLGLYSYTSFIDYIADAKEVIKNMPFWEANYNDSPWNLADTFFTNRIGHQYSEKGFVIGVDGYCDVNSFNEGALLADSTIPGSWEIQDSKWWYKHEDGSYTKNGWEKIDDKWYLFDSEGYMIYDWKKDGANWYYLGDANDGSMKTGWIYDRSYSKWYYFNKDGKMQTGWIEIDGKWYYLDKSGAMKTGWITDGNKLYCCYSSGEMIHDCTMYGYSFASNGVATKLS